jgi:polar amino acid transport system permease protein
MTQWLLRPWALLALIAALITAIAMTHESDTVSILLKWLPLVLLGFLVNIVVGVLAMALGTVAGLPLGMTQLAGLRVVRTSGWLVIQLLRNAPWLVLLFYVMFLLPFELHIGALTIPLPAWMKAVVGLALPVSANVAEIVRGGLVSIPKAQWESAESLAFSRWQILMLVILPQAFRRMLPPWMNLYAILLMSTTLISIVGIQDGLSTVRAAVSAEGRPSLMMPFYLLLLVLFFAHTYPVARFTTALERRLRAG